ncbi:MAG TPA: 4Fe-4S binding protein [Thermoplasmata archaeon]|jgi:NADH-quinone oxidoreductase chain I
MAQKRKIPGSGGIVIRPMIRTGKQFVNSFIKGKPNTILYPYQILDLPPTYRGKHTLDFNRCIGCGNCIQICPNDCMWMEKLEDPELGKIERPGVDMGRCLFCGLCVEVCPTVAIHHTVEFELADYKRDKLRYGPKELRDDKFADKFKEERTKQRLPVLDMSKCTSCEKCAGACPEMVIAMMPIENVGRSKPEINLAKCTSCEKCVIVCPEKALEMKEIYESYFEMPEPKFLLKDCTGCGACAKACPADAIYMLEMPGTEKILKDGKKGKPKKRAVFVLEKCVGCGKCFRACKFEAIEMPGVRK